MNAERSEVVQWLGLVVALMVLGAAIVWHLYADHRDTASREQARLSAEAQSITDNLEHQLRAASNAMAVVRGEFLSRNAGGAAPVAVSGTYLEAVAQAMPGVRTLSILNAEGTVVASNRSELIGRSFPDRAYFRVARDAPNPDMLYISPPFKTVLGVFALNVTRTILEPDGSFGGIVSATLDPEYFRALMKSVLYAPDMWNSIVHIDGTLFMLEPDRAGLPGMNLARPDSLFTQHVTSNAKANVFVGTSHTTGESRMSALRTLQPDSLAMDRSLVVQINRDLDTIFATWRRDVSIKLGFFGLFALATTLGLYAFQWRRRQFAQQAAEAASALQHSVERLKLATQASSIAVWDYDPESGRIEWDASMFALYGIARTDAPLTLDVWRQAVLPEDLPGAELMLSNSIDRGMPYQNRFRIWRADGEIRHIQSNATVFRNADGKPTRMVGTNQDITERERVQQQLVDSLREVGELKAALDAHAIVAVTDARGVITRVNDKFCSISQYPRSELIGLTHQIINSGYHPKSFFEDLWMTISRGQVWNGEICNRAKDGSLYWVYTTIVPFIGADGVPLQYIAIRADITKRKEAEQEAQRLAFHDELTGLPNRRLMRDRLTQAISGAARESLYGALLLMDLDNFKDVNDTLGHAQGDELLRQVSARLLRGVRNSDTVARLGGDEFVVLLGDLAQDLEIASVRAGDLGEKMRETLAYPYDLNGQLVNTTPSIGIVLFHDTSDDPDELLKQADMALYRAKEAGRNRLSFFDPALQAEITARALLVRDLRHALERNEMRLYYQPVVDSEGRILGVEALVRWQHPTRGVVPPVHFIPLSEQINLIQPIGQWVLQTACAQLAQWAVHPARAHWTMAVNVSERQFNDPDFVGKVERAIDQSDADARLLRLEITESMLHDDLNLTMSKMHALRRRGVKFSLDDFGTGYSSLSYLKKLPLDQLKIDKSFVDDVLTDSNNASIVRTILSLATTLDLSVVAEGVETRAQRDFLADCGCRGFQGYLFSRPVPVEQLPDVLPFDGASSGY
jgi:diguanylate cyclase (GGDEF)-like protein/PAS domain S-box-containing protein